MAPAEVGPHPRPARRAARDREDPLTPPPVRRLARIARFGARDPARRPTMPTRSVAIGPAAIKLGQTLATRPDLVGEEAAHNLPRLQDALPPVPFAVIRQTIEASLRRAAREPLRRVRRGAGRRRLDRAGPSRGDDRGPRRRGQGAAPRRRGRVRRRSTPMNGPRRRSRRYGGEVARLRPRLVIAHFKPGPRASSTCGARRPRPPNCARRWPPSPAITCRRSTGSAPPAGADARMDRRHQAHDRDALIAAGHDCEALAATLVRAFLRQAIADGFFHADMHQGNLFALPTAASPRSTSASWAGSTGARGCGSPKSSTA